MYPKHRPDAPVPASPDLPAIERDVLEHWRVDGTFEASVDARPAGEHGSNEFVFYDGPPFANGLPHYGHLLTGYVKDVVPRYQTMRGRRVERRFGWDTHGLPAELEAERILGITDKSQIEEMGIAAFNAACRQSVLRYTGEWQTYVTRQARWVDFEHDYKTLDLPFMESVLWAFKQLFDKGLAYEGYRVLPYCWRDQTPLSAHELKMDDDVYADRQDRTVTVSFPLDGGRAEELGLAGVRALAWTTTPWTLPTNAALALGSEISYVVVPHAVPEGDRQGKQAQLSGEWFLLAEDRLADYAKDLGYASADDAHGAVTRRVRGAELAGVRYRPLWPWFVDAYGPNAFQVLVEDYVSTEDGTGLVHESPAYGEVDQESCERAGIPTVLSVDAAGVFTASVPDFAGEQVFDANPAIIRRLEADGRLLRESSYVHSYPHCWRCRNPLIYKAVSSWFVRVSAFRDRMVELNQGISWTPEHLRDGQFGKWLAGARDWSISRNRYWGTPIPVWVSDDPEHPRMDVYGSLAELEADFGALPRNEAGEVDLHRPFIDELTRQNPDDPTGGSTMRRIPDVLDVWFDSGSMPFAQVHYPFENADWFARHYPGDFIVEYIGQTRGWFYTLHVLATALFDRPAFSSCVSHGIVLGDDGRKASKSLRNYPDPMEMFDTYGSDAVRWALMSSPVLRGGNLVVAEENIREGVRQVLLPLWSTWYFFTLYAGAANGGQGYRAAGVSPDRVSALPVMDRYVLARTRELVERVTVRMDSYDVAAACEAVREHLDMLTNWYVRTQRDRFWSEDHDAFDTLWTVLEALTRVMAPLAPMVAEEVWRGLTGERSVHLADWPAQITPGEVQGDASGWALTTATVDVDPALALDTWLVRDMDRVREVVSTVLGLRKANGLRVRQPLRELAVAVADPSAIEPYVPLLAAELNVKHVTLVDLAEAGPADLGVERRLTVNARAAGPRLGKQVQAVIRGAKAGQWTADDDGVTVTTDDGPVAMVEGEYELATVVADGGPEGQVAAVLTDGGVVLLDTVVDAELEAEGFARDVVRVVQDERKAAGLQVSDRIQLTLRVPADRVAAVAAHEALITRETLTVALDVQVAEVDGPEATVQLA